MAKIALAHARTSCSQARTEAKNPEVLATAVAAAGGAVALGVSGGAAGLMAGGSLGAIVGLVPALFTFGLSIPVCATFGGGMGLCVGTSMGASLGALGGGAAGYSAYVKRDELKSGSSRAWERVANCTDYVRSKAHASASYVSDHLGMSLLAAGTGGTRC